LPESPDAPPERDDDDNDDDLLLNDHERLILRVPVMPGNINNGNITPD
jgi:hypothetical protein